MNHFQTVMCIFGEFAKLFNFFVQFIFMLRFGLHSQADVFENRDGGKNISYLKTTGHPHQYSLILLDLGDVLTL